MNPKFIILVALLAVVAINTVEAKRRGREDSKVFPENGPQICEQREGNGTADVPFRGTTHRGTRCYLCECKPIPPGRGDSKGRKGRKGPKGPKGRTAECTRQTCPTTPVTGSSTGETVVTASPGSEVPATSSVTPVSPTDASAPTTVAPATDGPTDSGPIEVSP